jgi:alkylmercury lyase
MTITRDITEETESYGYASCCSVPTVDTDEASALGEVKAHEIAPEIAALRSTGFELLLDEGRPIEITEWAEAAGLDEPTITDALSRHSGRVELDDQGRLLGIAGLTIEPNRHELEIEGQKRWTWCALDSIGIMGALSATGIVRSRDPKTGDAVEIPFTEGTPDADAHLFILGGYDGGNVREEWCPLVNFFTSRDDAETWVAEKGLTGDIVSVLQIAEEAAEMWRPVTDSTAPQVC